MSEKQRVEEGAKAGCLFNGASGADAEGNKEQAALKTINPAQLRKFEYALRDMNRYSESLAEKYRERAAGDIAAKGGFSLLDYATEAEKIEYERLQQAAGSLGQPIFGKLEEAAATYGIPKDQRNDFANNVLNNLIMPQADKLPAASASATNRPRPSG